MRRDHAMLVSKVLCARIPGDRCPVAAVHGALPRFADPIGTGGAGNEGAMATTAALVTRMTTGTTVPAPSSSALTTSTGPVHRLTRSRLFVDTTASATVASTTMCRRQTLQRRIFCQF